MRMSTDLREATILVNILVCLISSSTQKDLCSTWLINWIYCVCSVLQSSANSESSNQSLCSAGSLSDKELEVGWVQSQSKWHVTVPSSLTFLWPCVHFLTFSGVHCDSLWFGRGKTCKFLPERTVAQIWTPNHLSVRRQSNKPTRHPVNSKNLKFSECTTVH